MSWEQLQISSKPPAPPDEPESQNKDVATRPVVHRLRQLLADYERNRMGPSAAARAQRRFSIDHSQPGSTANAEGCGISLPHAVAPSTAHPAPECNAKEGLAIVHDAVGGNAVAAPAQNPEAVTAAHNPAVHNAAARNPNVVHTGMPALDARLPCNGVPRAATIEIEAQAPGAGALEIALRIALTAADGVPLGASDPESESPPPRARRSDAQAQMSQIRPENALPPTLLSTHYPLLSASEARPVFLIDPKNEFHPPAAAYLGFDLDRLIIVRPPDEKAALWAADQCLRCRAVAAVVVCVDNVNDIQSRRLQLAAEIGGGIGILLRESTRRARSTTRSFATLRLTVSPSGSDGVRRQCQVSVTHVREGTPSGPFIVELPDVSGAGSISAELAARTVDAPAQRAAG